MSEHTSGAESWRQQALAITVHRACRVCTAPGKYVNDERIKAEFPACYVDMCDERYDTPVGERCPHCNSLREPGLVEALGEVWRKVFGKGD